jgi:hypothetical protein
MGSSQSAIVNQSELPRGNGAASSKHHKKRSRSECNTAHSNSSSTTQTENVVPCENYTLAANTLGLQTLSDSINHNDVPPLDKSSDDAYHESWESLLQNGGNVARGVTSDFTNTQFNLHGQTAALSKGVGDVAKARKAKKDGIIFGMKCVELAVNFGLVAYIFKFTRDENGMRHEEYRGTLTHTDREPFVCMRKENVDDDEEYKARHFEEGEIYHLDREQLGNGESLGVLVVVHHNKYNEHSAYLAETMGTLNRNFCACVQNRVNHNNRTHGIGCVLMDLKDLMKPTSSLCINENWLYPFGYARGGKVQMILRCPDFDSERDQNKMAIVSRTGGRGKRISSEERTRRKIQKREQKKNSEERKDRFVELYFDLLLYIKLTNFNPSNGALYVTEKLCKLHDIPMDLYHWYRYISGLDNRNQWHDLTQFERDILESTPGVLLNAEDVRNSRRTDKWARILKVAEENK